MNIFSSLILFNIIGKLVSNINGPKLLSDEDDIYKKLTEHLNFTRNLDIILGYLNETYKSDPTTKCLLSIHDIYQNNEKELEISYEGSSKGFVDMSSFSTCLSDDNHTFYTIYPNHTTKAIQDITQINKKNSEEHLWIFGICLRKNICTSDDIGKIFDAINELFNHTFSLYGYNRDGMQNVIIDNFEESKNEYRTFKKAFPKLLIFLPLIIQIIFMIVKIIPVKLFGCCLRRKYLRELDENIKNQNYDDLSHTFHLTKQIDLKIRKCFSISEIVDDLSYSKNNDLFKDEDMTFIRGIKTLGIIFFIIGHSFIILYSYPLCISGVEKRELYMTATYASFFIICFRLSPALILSSSGFSLCYKFLSFLDKKLANLHLDNPDQNDNDIYTTFSRSTKIELNEEIIRERTTESLVEKIGNKNKYKHKERDSIKENTEINDCTENTLGIKFYDNVDLTKKVFNKMFKGQKLDEKNVLSKIDTNRIPLFIYFGFILRQIHKALFLILGFETFKYGIPFLLVLVGKSPMIFYIYKTLYDKLGDPGLNIIFVGNFIDLFKKDNKFLMMRLFCIPMSEFSFFIICSIIIFICYKKNFRLDIIIIIIILVILVFKIVYIVTDLSERNPGMFYTDTKYQKFFLNPIFNMDFYLMGMFFGIVNYVVQNGITYEESFIKKRPFVKMPLFFLRFLDYNKYKNYICYILLLILMVFSLIIVPILFTTNFENIIKNNNPNIIFIIFSLIDIELFIISFYFFLLSSYISGANIFFQIFNAEFSSYGLKLSYWVVYAIPSLSYIIIYENGANFNLNFTMVIIYSFIILFIVCVVCVIYFLVMEMPYKKLIKLFFNISAEINKVYLEEDNDEKIQFKMDDLNENDLLNDINDENSKDKNIIELEEEKINN